MKRSLLPLAINLIFTIHLNAQTTIAGGDVYGVWTQANSPYLVTGEITIPGDSLLVIEPGVLVEFQGHYKFNVKGTIYAIGTQLDSITFTVYDTTGFENLNSTNGGWHGLRFSRPGEHDTSFLKYCHLSYGKAIGPEYNDKEGGAVRVSDNNSLIISNCLINHNFAEYLGAGIFTYSNQTYLLNCVFTNNLGNAIFFYDNAFIIGNKVINNDGTGIFGVACNFIISNNLIANNEKGIHLDDFYGGTISNNTICYNYSEHPGAALDFTFFSDVKLFNNICFFNTSETGSSINFDNYDPFATTWSVYFYNCNIENGLNSIGGMEFKGTYENNIDCEPYFQMTGDNPFAITANSACINSGSTDTTGLMLPYYDLAKNPRFYNNSRIDIGAYEFQGEPDPLPEIGVLADALDFGVITKNNHSLVQKVPVHNYGHGPLTVNLVTQGSFYIKTEGAEQYSQNITSLIIPPKSDTNFLIKFIPSDALQFIENLTITSNDADDPEIAVNLKGQGTDLLVLEGTISSDSLICADRVLINNPLTVEEGTTLTICAGTHVELLGNYSIVVNGILKASGEVGDSIQFKLCNDFSFISDTLRYWRGIHFINESSQDSSKIQFCIIRDVSNYDIILEFYGGAIYAEDYSNLLIERSHITQNPNPSFAGPFTNGISCYHSSPEIRYNLLDKNSRSAIRCESSSHASIYTNIITKNGGGIYTDFSSPTIDNNIIFSNDDAGISENRSYSDILNNFIHHNSPGIYLRHSYTSHIHNNLIANNADSFGGGIIIFDSYPKVINNTIVNNTGTNGGGIKITDSNPELVNNILCYNNSWESGSQIYFQGTSSALFQYNNIDGGFDSIGFHPNGTFNGVYENNFDTLPMFINAGKHPYMLSPESPLIDAGNPDTTTWTIPDLDYAGNPRFWGDHIDIGAYEYGIYPPFFTTEPVLEVEANTNYYYLVQAEDKTGNQLEFNYDFLPNWMTMALQDSIHAELTGVPLIEDEGMHPVKITVSNSLYETTQEFDVNVLYDQIDEISGKKIIIAPNPTSATILVKILGLGESINQIQCFSNQGQLLKTKTFTNADPHVSLNLSDLSPGIYYLQVQTDAKVYFEKIIYQ
jgi:parallel beta-helix repeat protein